MTPPDPFAEIVLLPSPNQDVARIILIAIRRLAVGGLADAHATTILMGELGIAYRRPLMFLRILLSEISRIAQRPIVVAPHCCRRITVDESCFLTLIDSARDDPDTARAAVARMTASLDCLSAVSVAQALADALEDLGRPFASPKFERKAPIYCFGVASSRGYGDATC